MSSCLSVSPRVSDSVYSIPIPNYTQYYRKAVISFSRIRSDCYDANSQLHEDDGGRVSVFRRIA